MVRRTVHAVNQQASDQQVVPGDSHIPRPGINVVTTALTSLGLLITILTTTAFMAQALGSLTERVAGLMEGMRSLGVEQARQRDKLNEIDTRTLRTEDKVEVIDGKLDELVQQPPAYRRAP